MIPDFLINANCFWACLPQGRKRPFTRSQHEAAPSRTAAPCLTIRKHWYNHSLAWAHTAARLLFSLPWSKSHTLFSRSGHRSRRFPGWRPQWPRVTTGCDHGWPPTCSRYSVCYPRCPDPRRSGPAVCLPAVRCHRPKKSNSALLVGDSYIICWMHTINAIHSVLWTYAIRLGYIKFLYSINNNQYDDILTYNEFIKHISKE